KRDGESLNDRYMKLMVKFEGRSIFIWECFIYLSVGYLIQIEEGLDGDLYRQILNDEFLNTLEFYELNAQDIIF
ncbi:hypothetical protein GLOIN_2v1438795, partial [Rhizophagus irregularis DAOM 181602=DAOM 197198]